MDILMVPVPLFSQDMAVEGYCFSYHRGNGLTEEAKPAAFLDGAMNSALLDTLRLVGLEPFAMEKPMFVPITAYMLLGDLARQCPQPFSRIVFLMDTDVLPTEEYIEKIKAARENGFRFAMRGVTKHVDYIPILLECEFLFLDQKSKSENIDPTKLPQGTRHLKLIAANIDTFDDFTRIPTKRFALFEGPFYRIPITKGRSNIAPLKVNLIRLLNTTQDNNFDFGVISGIIERDTVLSVSLLQIVNSASMNLSQRVKSISQAVALLGENEMRKWTTTSVSRLLGSDKPDEITKLSLIRARFAENLAPVLKLQKYAQSLFLMGLFSVLDAVLEVSMKEALSMVHVDEDITHALVSHTGPFYPALQFIFSYEQSDWREVSRRLIIDDASVEAIYDAYIGATLWYKELIDEAAVTAESPL